MIITSVRSDLYVKTPNGLVRIKVGSYDYPIDYKDPAVSAQLRVLRKHRGVAFNELLESDVEVLAKLPKGATADDKKAALLTANSPKNQRQDLKPKKKVKNPKPAKHSKVVETKKKDVKIDSK